ncbi:MAG: hypothetical protein DCC58_04985 [Chloroflexi bacterium]|nr:MAG: hypothetical protein DCC58_04985 [Chloroflexota bacterium]
MTSFKRIFESLRRGMQVDSSFETYYGSLIRNSDSGNPTASEARRDFATLRSQVDRSLIF